MLGQGISELGGGGPSVVEFLGPGVYFDALWFCSDNRE